MAGRSARAVLITAALVAAIGATGLVVPEGDDGGRGIARADAAAVPTAVRTARDTGTPLDRAWAWIASRTGSPTDVTGRSTIAAARAYPTSWTGPVSGSFDVRDPAPPTTDTASLTVTSPATVTPGYRGVVEGRVLAPAADGRWIVQVYRITADGPQQVPLQALAAPDGSFTLDLAEAGTVPEGRWSLGLLDATDAYAPYGTPWPSGVYRDWVVRATVVTDTAYVVGEQPARTDGTFTFATSRPGVKVFQLVDTRTDAVLAEAAPDLGLVRSHAGSAGVYAYDQALAVIAGLALDRDVRPLVSGLQRLQSADGGFVESADVRNPDAAAPVKRSGISAVAVYALLRALQDGRGDPGTRRAATTGLAWLLDRRRADGLVDAGTGARRPDGSVDADAEPGWASTEHNLDAWQALRLAARVLDDPAYARAADALSTAILARLWDAADGRFLQGIAPDGSPDVADPLDVNSWGALFLHAVGRDDLARRALARTERFASAVGERRGYRSYYPQSAFPSAPENVWAEGGAGVAVAAARLDDGTGTAAADVLADLTRAQQSDGGVPCAARSDDGTGMTSRPCVAAGAWFVIAASDDPIWDGA
ncbi:hypothetical protein [Jatrophihabitans fulvus]